MKGPVEVDVDDLLPIVEREIGEPLEAVHACSVDEHRHGSQLGADALEGGVDRGTVGDVGGVGELLLAGIEIEGRYLKAVGPKTIRDRGADARSAPGHHSGLHKQASPIKNHPFEYENRTLAHCSIARQCESDVRTGETFIARLSHGSVQAAAVPSIFLSSLTANV